MGKIMFWVGIAIAAVTAVLLLTVEADLSLGAIGVIGIVCIATSKYRPMQKK